MGRIGGRWFAAERVRKPNFFALCVFPTDAARRAPSNPFRPITEIANESIARQIDERVATYQTPQPGSWREYAAPERSVAERPLILKV
jgi:hypothetical protein